MAVGHDANLAFVQELLKPQGRFQAATITKRIAVDRANQLPLNRMLRPLLLQMVVRKQAEMAAAGAKLFLEWIFVRTGTPFMPATSIPLRRMLGERMAFIRFQCPTIVAMEGPRIT